MSENTNYNAVMQSQDGNPDFLQERINNLALPSLVNSEDDSGDMVYENLEPKRRNVLLGKPPVKYILIEAMAGAGASYKSFLSTTARMDDGKVIGVSNVGDIEPFLVSLCLCRTNTDGSLMTRVINRDSVPVTVDIGFVKKLPQKAVTEMFEWIKRNSSGLGDTDTIESLESRIKADKKRLEELRGKLKETKKLPED